MSDELPKMRVEKLGEANVDRFLRRGQAIEQEVEVAVQGIEQLIRRDGDKALLELTRRLDGVEIPGPFLPQPRWDELARQCDAEIKQAIDNNHRRIRAFHELQVIGRQEIELDGMKLWREPVPYQAVGCYVPGGRAIYPSSVLMTVTPAALAGVGRIIIATPPNKQAEVEPAIAYAAKVAGATDILLCGGAQAVFALALGTKKVPRVQAIVGPGNSYVTVAKQWVTNLVHTDAPAGPSELVVLADGTAPVESIAYDLMAQAEHDPDARVVLVTTSDSLAAKVIAKIEELLPDATRKDIISKSLEHAGFLVGNHDDCVSFVNEYAPERLEIMMGEPVQVQNAGSVFIGPNTPVSLGDYGSGTNHVLPTMGFATLRGGLAVDDFRKWITYQEASKEALGRVAKDITTMARVEGLDAHADAVEKRL